jgi:hypothetical protein
MTFQAQGVDHVAMERRFDGVRAGLAERGIDAGLWDHTICHSLSIRDPDGHQVELTTYDVA